MIPLSGFTQGLIKRDSLRCYTPYELRAISNKLIDGAECDTLLKIANAVIKDQDKTIISLQQTTSKQDERYTKTNHLVTLCESEKKLLEKEGVKVTELKKGLLDNYTVSFSEPSISEALIISSKINKFDYVELNGIVQKIRF